MDIFVRDVPLHASEKQLKQLFTPYLAQFGIHDFDVSKFRNKPLASITVLDANQGHLFLSKYGFGSRSQNPPRLSGSLLKLSPSKNHPSDIQLRTLEEERNRRLAKAKAPAHVSSTALPKGRSGQTITRFHTTSVSCGVWTYQADNLVFQSHFIDPRPGSIILGARQAVLLLNSDGVSADMVYFNYYNIDTVLTGDWTDPKVTFSSYCPPRFYRKEDNSMHDLAAMLAGINLNAQGPSATKKLRLPCINRFHSLAAGVCFAYQFHLLDRGDLSKIHALVSQNRNVQSSMIFQTATVMPKLSLGDSFTRLNFDLTDQSRYGSLPFGMRFQILRLAQNGKLLPDQVRALLPCIGGLHSTFGPIPTVEAVRRLYLYLHTVPGPHTESEQYSQTTLEANLQKYAASYDIYGAEDAYSLAHRHAHIVLVHRINVTPAGTYLEGPSAEVTNRVLRSYPDHVDSFLRSSFMDEDGESIRFDPRASPEMIYHGRFKDFLDGSFNIAGQSFSFLGFSHSSLRSQTCWFMSPFFFNGNLMMSPRVIKGLGNFSQIRSPARCAARIGQAFTDTTGTVEVAADMLVSIPDVERNGRTFSDGCGTISQSLLKRVWRVYGGRKSLKPTIIQIRFAGAKGVVSLDSRIPDDALCLRPSMVKFRDSPSTNIEICGAAFKPLPMILNRGYIKILEDLGVPIDVFMTLQGSAVDNLRLMTTSTINASIFLGETSTSKAAQLPTLLEHLSDIGLEYQDDVFLRDVVEMAIITKLRDMKYRGRIPVKSGVTLYGIMDETGFLQEDEVYVTVERSPQGGQQVLTGGKVIITRSPALHPGDIRTVRAIDVPANSPLSKLSNCVVFSQHGARDLPSKLSGGDLDGDLYNVIFEPSLMPRRAIAEPADYPSVKPIELDREVTTKDMSDFFVQFMETDQLGQISTVHVQLADQKEEGVFHPDCIKLAQMASTAVDFSKTGIPVNMQECPRRDRNRPDFMAPSPRFIIDDGGASVLPDDDQQDDMENDPVADLDPANRRIRYYRSEKALGHLYRAIDEQQFLRSIHNRHKPQAPFHSNTLLPKLWDYVKRNNILVEWEHNRQLARQIKEAYETKLLDHLFANAPSPNHPLTEAELFAGTILGRAGGAQSKQLRELTNAMRDRFEELLEFTVYRIVQGDSDGEDRNYEAFPRAIACFAVGMEESSLYDRTIGGLLKSWSYVAAGVCLRQMKRWMAMEKGRYTLPPL